MPANCGNCGAAFHIQPEEQEWIAANEGDSPGLCPRCRAFKSGLQDESITCSVCGKVFIYPRELRLFVRMFNWSRPKRYIGGCRKDAVPLTEAEAKTSDFLRRLRAANKVNAITRGGMHSPMGSSSITRRAMTSGNSDKSTSTEPVGGSLAQALKEFQEKRRRRG